MNSSTAVATQPSRSGSKILLSFLAESFVGFLIWSAMIAAVRMVWEMAGGV